MRNIGIGHKYNDVDKQTAAVISAYSNFSKNKQIKYVYLTVLAIIKGFLIPAQYGNLLAFFMIPSLALVTLCHPLPAGCSILHEQYTSPEL